MFSFQYILLLISQRFIIFLYIFWSVFLVRYCFSTSAATPKKLEFSLQVKPENNKEIICRKCSAKFTDILFKLKLYYIIILYNRIKIIFYNRIIEVNYFYRNLFIFSIFSGHNLWLITYIMSHKLFRQDFFFEYFSWIRN